MSKQVLTFSMFLIHNLAEAWNMPPRNVYAILNRTKVLDDYIIPCYDMLHTQGTKYLVEDITDFVQERGGF